jgi:hypothetical protein
MKTFSFQNAVSNFRFSNTSYVAQLSRSSVTRPISRQKDKPLKCSKQPVSNHVSFNIFVISIKLPASRGKTFLLSSNTEPYRFLWCQIINNNAIPRTSANPISRATPAVATIEARDSMHKKFFR